MKKLTLKSCNIRLCLCLGFMGIAVLLLVGCESAKISTSEQMTAFELAGPITPQVDLDKLLRAKNNQGTYITGAGDVIEIQMPSILTAISPNRYARQNQPAEPYLCRVADNGAITLPIIGQITAQDKTLAQIEAEIVDMYFPRYLVERPSVVCAIKEYHLTNVTIVGAVVEPGVYKLKSNEMSLVNLIMQAGGIIEDGASLITITSADRTYPKYAANRVAGPVVDDEVLHWVEFGEIDAEYIEFIDPLAENTINNSDKFENLEVDLVFRPKGQSRSKGTLLIQRGEKTIFAKAIDLASQFQISAYINELQTTVGPNQGKIVGAAIEQLAAQLSPAVVSKPIATKLPERQRAAVVRASNQYDSEDEELIAAADEINESFIEVPEQSSGCPSCDASRKRAELLQQQMSTQIEEIEYIEPVVTEVYEPVTEPIVYQKPESDKYIEENAQSNYEDIEMVAELVNENVAPANEPQPVLAASASVEPIILPVKGLNIPFADVPLKEGDLVEVKRLNPAVFTVIGLAKKPGAFPYPPDMEYNLMQAIGFAGGVDLVSDPRFVTLYRQNANGGVVSATVRIDKKFMAKSYNVKIKPGDVISLDVTPRTKTNALLHQVLKVNLGFYVNPFSN